MDGEMDTIKIKNENLEEITFYKKTCDFNLIVKGKVRLLQVKEEIKDEEINIEIKHEELNFDEKCLPGIYEDPLDEYVINSQFQTTQLTCQDIQNKQPISTVQESNVGHNPNFVTCDNDSYSCNGSNTLNTNLCIVKTYGDKLKQPKNNNQYNSSQSNQITEFIKTRLKIKKHFSKDDVDSEGKYRCPFCKRKKMFYTLKAVNNHLKFEHMLVISNRKSNGNKNIKFVKYG